MDGIQPNSGSIDSSSLENIFEERAENLSRNELFDWSAPMPNDAEILRKIKGPGAKLLTGPRGSGKSTIFRRAYFELLDSTDVLPAYVNYARSLALEPYFHRRANALQIFQQWLIAKIIYGITEAARALDYALPVGLEYRRSTAENLIHDLETGANNTPAMEAVSPSQLVVLLEEWTTFFGRRRCVLLLDDAAHAFSSEQQREFFEVFRALKSRLVAAKAAVYPGVTSYSPNFHIGHEAELMEVWCNPHDTNYLAVMRDVIARRLPAALNAKLKGREELIDYLALASFGIPRAFLNMVAQLVGVDEDSPSRPSKTLADAAISAHAQSVRSIFVSLSRKLPRFKNFIDIGKHLQAAITQYIKEYNYGHPTNQKAVSVAIAEPISPEISRILGFMEYAGMVRKMESFSRGNRGVYQRYSVHYAILVDEKALSLGKFNSAQNIVDVLTNRDAHAIPHTKESGLVTPDQIAECILDLEPCPHCGAARASSEARFCVRCGHELKESSIYEELLKSPIDRLPLTERKIEGLKTESRIKTVKDILLDEESVEIRKVTGVGPVWARRIHNAAEEFVSV